MTALVSLTVTACKDESEVRDNAQALLLSLGGGTETEASDGRSQTCVCINITLGAC